MHRRILEESLHQWNEIGFLLAGERADGLLAFRCRGVWIAGEFQGLASCSFDPKLLGELSHEPLFFASCQGEFLPDGVPALGSLEACASIQAITHSFEEVLLSKTRRTLTKRLDERSEKVGIGGPAGDEFSDKRNLAFPGKLKGFVGKL